MATWHKRTISYFHYLSQLSVAMRRFYEKYFFLIHNNVPETNIMLFQFFSNIKNKQIFS